MFSQSDGTSVRTTENGFVQFNNDVIQIQVIVQQENLAIFLNGDLEYENSKLEFWGIDNLIYFPNPRESPVYVDIVKFWNLEGVEIE